jgi:capsular polysaccharide biosynthesis protein
MTALTDFTLIDILRVAFKKRKTILMITLCIAIISAIVAVTMPVYYKSTALFYPTNLGLSDRSAIFSEKQSESEFTYYGGKHDANRIITLAQSAKIVDFAINYFNLAKHYGYDTARDDYWRTLVKKEFLENYSVIKTDKDAIEITLYDTDKNLCAKIVNTIVEKIDEHSKEPIKIGKNKVVGMISKEVESKSNELNAITAELVAWRSAGVLSISGDMSANPSFSGKDLAIVEQAKLKFFKQQALINDLKELNKILAQHKAAANDNVSAVSILEHAYPAEKKSKPVRWIIVVVSTLMGFIFAVLLAFILEYFPRLKEAVISPNA